jgi:hypothetical protein
MYYSLSVFSGQAGVGVNHKKITNRQTEALRAVHTLTQERGSPPTLGELRNALGVSSDQAVIELLNRLEAKGLIDRVPGVARGIRLSGNGYLALGIPQSTPNLRGVSWGLLMLNPHQQRIVERLHEIDPELAGMYVGGLRVLLDEANPERIPQSAHSIREITGRLSNLGQSLLSKDESAAASESKASNARRLEKLFDPLGGVARLGDTLYDTWNKQFHQFFVAVTHHGKKVAMEEYLAQLAEYEEFLSGYVLPRQPEAYALIDRFLRGGPDEARPEDLKRLLTRNVESYRYFFRLANIRWLDFLLRNDLLTPNWEVAQYLARTAPDAPEEAMAIIEPMTTGENDGLARSAFLDAAMQMPPSTASRLISKIGREKWLEGPSAEWLPDRLGSFFAKFVASGKHADAVRLARLFLEARADGQASRRDLHGYHYAEFLKLFGSVPPHDAFPYLKLLVDVLHGMLCSEGSNTVQDGSVIWRPAIEENTDNWGVGEPRDLLVSALRDGLERYTAHAIDCRSPGLKNKLEQLLSREPAYVIFQRLRLHLYRLHAAEFQREIEEAILKCCDDASFWHENELLVKETFPAWSSETRDRYFALIDAGPGGGHSAEYIEHWKVRRLLIIRSYLRPADEAKYGRLLARFAAEQPELPGVRNFRLGPTSPTTAQDLASMPINGLIDYLVAWVPPQGWLVASVEGLGRDLSAAVGQDATAFSRVAAKFADARLRPIYVYHYLMGLIQGLRQQREAQRPHQEQSLQWDAVLALVHKITERAIASTLPQFPTDGDRLGRELSWDAVYQAMASLLTAALDLRSGGPGRPARGLIWRTISFLCDHPDPTEREGQFEGNALEPFTLSINSVRGQAFHALFAYIYWCDRQRQAGETSDSRVPPEAKAVLEEHLDADRDPSLTVRSVYGWNFPRLYVYDPAWASGLVGRLFPPHNDTLRYAAWETYLSQGVFDSVYRALRPQYEQAISEVRKFKPDRRYWADPAAGLAHHMMTAYAYRFDDGQNPLWRSFFRVASAKQRATALSSGGRAYVQRDESAVTGKLPTTERLQQFWDWRLEESKEAEELCVFGWWVRKGKFDNRWLLDRLLKTLEKTGGAINGGVNVMAMLRDFSSEAPDLCVHALELLAKSRAVDRGTLIVHEGDIKAILSRARACGDRDSAARAERIIDHLTKLGFETYRSIPAANLEAPAVTGA